MTNRSIEKREQSKPWPVDPRTQKKVPHPGYRSWEGPLNSRLEDLMGDVEELTGQEGALGILVVEGENPGEITLVATSKNPFHGEKTAVAQALMKAAIGHLADPDN